MSRREGVEGASNWGSLAVERRRFWSLEFDATFGLEADENIY